MGCWNGTCGISQLPIIAGEKIWAFLIGVTWGRSDGREQSGYCYHTDVGFPMSLPIYGEYNGYGSIENIQENYNTKLIMDAYAGEDFKNIEQFLRHVERDKLFLEDKYDKRYGVGLFMILDDVVRDLRNTKYEWSKERLAQNVEKDAEYFFKEAKIKFKELDKIDADLKEIGKKLDKEIYGMFDDCAFLGTKYKSMNKGYNTFINIYNQFNSTGRKSLWPYRDYIEKLVRNNKTIRDPEVKELVRDTINFEVVNSSLYALRKSWIPQSGKGSQSEELSFYWKLTTAMRRIISKREAQYKKERE